MPVTNLALRILRHGAEARHGPLLHHRHVTPNANRHAAGRGDRDLRDLAGVGDATHAAHRSSACPPAPRSRRRTTGCSPPAHAAHRPAPGRVMRASPDRPSTCTCSMVPAPRVDVADTRAPCAGAGGWCSRAAAFSSVSDIESLVTVYWYSSPIGVETGPICGSNPAGRPPFASASRCCTSVRAKYTSVPSGNGTVIIDSPAFDTERTPVTPGSPHQRRLELVRDELLDLLGRQARRHRHHVHTACL